MAKTSQGGNEERMWGALCDSQAEPGMAAEIGVGGLALCLNWSSNGREAADMLFSHCGSQRAPAGAGA
jgi:hypothetical protein